MAGAAIGGLLGAFFGAGMTAGATFLGFSGSTLWMLGASIGSLFDQPSLDFGGSSPNYSFSEVHNSKSQLLPIPICYGRVRVAGNVFMQQFYDDKRQKMDMFVGLSQGPIHRVISVYANEHVLFGDGSDTYTYWTLSNGIWLEASYPEYVAFEGSKEIRDGEGNVATVDLQECSCDVHLGEPGQLKDSRESGELTYGRVAYLGITVKVQEGLTGNPTITTELEGREVWTPSGTRYTANPVWCITDLLTNKDYGVGVPLGAINIPAAEDAAAYCDELVDGRPRYSLNYIIDQQRPAPDILRDMFMCFDGYIREREQITICVNRPVSTPDAYLDLDNDPKQGTFKWWEKGREETYNRVIVEWVDPENHYERTSTPFEAQADMESRGLYERNISLLGVTDPNQVARLGEQALHIAQNINNFCSFTVSVCDWDFEIGDVIGITESAVTGWNRKWFHVLHMQDDPQSEECTVTLVEYDSSTYVNTPSQVPASTDNQKPPVVLDNYSNLLLTDVGSQQADGTYVPKIRVRYTPPTASMKEHVVSWWHNDDGKAGEKKISPSVRDVLISEGIETGKVLTVRVWGTDVNGKPRTGVVGQIVPGHDDIAPSPPTSLTTNGWFGEIILNWVNPITNEDGSPCKDLAYIEIWVSSSDDRATAVKIGEVNSTNFRHHLGSFESRYYWIRAVDTSGNISQWNAEAGVMGYSEQASHQDFVDYLLEHNPYLQRAIDDLNTPIEKIQLDLTEVKDITIPEIQVDIKGIKEVVIPEIDIDIKDINEVTIPKIETKIADLEIALPYAIQKLSERVRDINKSVIDELSAVSASAVEALLGISETNGRITDAGILVDPDTGEVRIWAVDQLKQETELRLVNAEMLISAQDAKIAQKVSLAEVDERIAQAVFGDVGELLVSGLNARINTAEQELDAMNAELLQKATQIEVDALGGRVGDAEVRISGAEAAIDLKATKIEVDEIGTRVTNAETSIDALNGQITQTVTAIGQDGKDLANLTAEGLVEAILNDADNHDRSKVSLAMAKEELYANIEEGLEAEAGQRLQLAVVVDDNKSLILNEQIVRSTNDESLAQSISVLSASTDAAIGSVNAAILDESEARTNADEAIASQVSSLQSTVETNDSEVRGLIASESSTRATADEAITSQVNTLQSTVADNDTEVRGLIATESSTRASADTAITEQVNTLQSKVDDNEATIQTISGTVANESSALAQQTFTMISKATDEVSEAVVEDILNQAEGREVAKKQYAVIRQEYNTKIEEGLLSEATKRETLASKLDQTEAIIQEDLRVLATKDEALAESIQTMGVELGEDIEAAIQEERIVRATAEEALAYEIETLQSRTGDNESAIQNEVTARTTADESLAEEIHTVMSKTEDNEAAIQTVSKTFADESSATGSHVFTMVSRLTDQTAEGLVEDILNQAEGRETAKEQYAIIREEYDAKIEEGILSEATKRELLAVKLGEAEAAIQEEALVRATQDGAIAETVKTMGVKFGEDIAAAIQEERRVTVEDDRALAEAIDVVQAKLGDSFSAVQTVERAISEQGTSLAEQITTLAASTISGEVSQSATPPASPTLGQVYFNTTESKYYRWTGTAWEEVKGLLGNQSALIQEVNRTSVDGDEALAERIGTLSTTVGNNTTSIQQTMQSVDGIMGKYTLKVDSSGYITGLSIIGGPDRGGIVMHCDEFMVGRPGALRYPFTIGTVNGVQTVSMESSFIQDAAIISAKIKDAEIGTLKIGGNAVSVMSASVASDLKDLGVMGDSTYHHMLSATISTLAGYPVLITFTATTQVVESTIQLWLSRNGGTIGGQANIVIAQFGESGATYGAAYSFVDTNPPGGNNTYSIHLAKVGGMAARVSTRSLTALHVKR
nr:phage tail protein [uncultured Dethiosulfovibrio sp.]